MSNYGNIKRAKHYHKVDSEEILQEHMTDEKDTYYVCKCPFCEEHGEPDSKSTLYMYKESMTGWCWRCLSYVVDKILVGNLSLKNKLRNDSIQKMNEIKLPTLMEVDISHLKHVTSKPYIDYFINKRSYKYLLHNREFDFREISFRGRKGIIIPFYYDGLIIDYQIRYLEDGKMKYYTSENDKIPYFPLGFDSKVRYKSITLVEGAFDATSAHILGLPNPMAVLGKSITEIIKKLLEMINPEIIYLAFDEWKINNDIANQLKKFLTSRLILVGNNTHYDIDECLKFEITPKISDYNEELTKFKDRMRLKRVQAFRDERNRKALYG